MSGKTCSKCYYLLVAARRHKFCLTLSSNAEACKDFREASVFDRITASPEVLAEKLVYQFIGYDGNGLFHGYWKSTITDEDYATKEEAIAATVEKLKEVCNE